METKFKYQNLEGVNHFIVYSKSRHKETFDVKGHDGELLATPPAYHDHSNAYREAEIVATPKGFEEALGGYLIFNYMVTSRRGASGGLEFAPGYFKVPFSPNDPGNSMCYGYIKNGTLIPFKGWVFMQEVFKEIEPTNSGLVIVQNIEDTFYTTGEQKPEKEKGKIAYAHKADLVENELNTGDVVSYRPKIGIEQDINGIKLVRIQTAHIVTKEVEE